MPTARANGADLWYELTSPPGRPDAPTLVLTHGFAGPWWPPVVDEFRARYRLLWYHVRGTADHPSRRTPARTASRGSPPTSGRSSMRWRSSARTSAASRWEG